MDRISIEVTTDGVKSSTEQVSPENHQSAEAFLQELAGLLGGETTYESLGVGEHHHSHVHGHTHSH